ncbi:MAG: TonB-dependent receptor, partial [Flavisolibacter sp.]|nr:TonB-dependent receptor [Flavisolibacter sp.]
LDTAATDTTILLRAATQALEEVIISSSRTESRIENLPTRVEVLGAEEVEEESGIKPGNIASLLGDVAGIQTQQTSAVTGNTEMRVQGLPGRYTQLLRDGMPLFGDFAGSFSILQIPPLDLKQIEIIKGATSTLYGGGAIAGMINLISKKPKLHTFEKTILLNYSTLKEANAHIYLSNRNEKTGYTFFGGVTHQQPVDVDKDGFSDVAGAKSYFIHPTFFFYPGKNNTISIGYNGTFENRRGGDMEVLNEGKNGMHQFFIQNKLARHTTDIQWESRIGNDRFTVKAIGSWFDRAITTNRFGMKGTQFSYYSEAAYVIRKEKNDVVFGVNFNGERFRKELPDSTNLPDFQHTTVGLFVQDDWRLHPKLTIESGLRTDFHNRYGNFVLPRLSLLYRFSADVTSRLGGGLGYKIPTVFTSDIDERDYPKLLPLQNIKPEQSYGANWDVNVQKDIGNVSAIFNQSFYITYISHPLLADSYNGLIQFINASNGVITKGFETYIQLDFAPWEVYLGYTLTDARKRYDATQPYVELSARNKFASVVAYTFSERFRAGLESAVTGRQYLEDGRRSPAYLFMAGMLRYDIKNVSLVLNGENLLDYRQNKKERIIIGSIDNPTFRQLWAPIDGRVINLSVRVRF